MTEQIKTYFENLRENAENDANKLSRGTLEAYWTYEFNLNHNSSEFECSELPWTTDMSDFVKTMREAGIEEWYITSCKKIKYMFPKAHATAYVMSAFRIAYYKVHYPIYFYASWFSTKATDFDIETMIKGHEQIKNRIVEIIKVMMQLIKNKVYLNV